MNTQLPADRPAAQSTPEPGHSHLEHALELKFTFGTVCAIEYLKAHDVAPETILQVATATGAAASQLARH